MSFQRSLADNERTIHTLSNFYATHGYPVFANSSARSPYITTKSKSGERQGFEATSVTTVTHNLRLEKVLAFYKTNRDFFAMPFLYPEIFHDQMIKTDPQFKKLQNDFSKQFNVNLTDFYQLNSKQLPSDLYKEEVYSSIVQSANEKSNNIKTKYKSAIVGENLESAPVMNIGNEKCYILLGNLSADIADTTQLSRFFDQHPHILLFIYNSLPLLEKLLEKHKAVFDGAIASYITNPKHIEETIHCTIDKALNAVLNKVPSELGLVDTLQELVNRNEINVTNYENICAQIVANYTGVFSTVGRIHIDDEKLIKELFPHHSAAKIKPILEDHQFRINLDQKVKQLTKEIGLADVRYRKKIDTLIIEAVKEKFAIDPKDSVSTSASEPTKVLTPSKPQTTFDTAPDRKKKSKLRKLLRFFKHPGTSNTKSEHHEKSDQKKNTFK